MRTRLVPAFGLLLGLAAGCGDATPDGSMAAGPHGDLDCAQCHTGPAVNGFTAAVSPGACAGCHESADLESTVEVHNVALPHATHPGPLEGELLSCTACHAHDTGEADLRIATGGCFLCHAELPADPAGSATLTESDCTACHVQPTHTAFATSGEPIDHATVLERGISCLLCHYDVTAGSGAAEATTCRTCHGIPGGPTPLRGGETMAAGAVHEMHMDTLVVMTCTRCHEPVDHRVVRLASSIVLDCGSCHAQGDPALRSPVDSAVHRASQVLYAGLDPHHADIQPALKFARRVACSSCHGPESTAMPAGSATRLAAIRQECTDCHGPRFGSLLGAWVAGMRLNTGLVGDYVRAAAADARVRGSAGADSLAQDAVALWSEIAEANGVHNLPAADELLRTALSSASAAYRRAGGSAPARPSLGPDPDEVSCVRCHYGVQTIQNPVYGQPFSHGDHVIDGSLACGRCHSAADLFQADGTTFDPAHGATRVSERDCATCHHVDRGSECTTCHTRSEVAELRLRADLSVHIQRGDTTIRREVPFSHELHGSLACADCHQSGLRQAPIACADCHESHHATRAGPRSCLTCHGTNINERHELDDHLVCGACHSSRTLSQMESADRAFCLTCHVAQTEHQPGGECSTCHLLLTPEEAMQRMVNARTAPRGRE